jgi:hypothetical protein
MRQLSQKLGTLLSGSRTTYAKKLLQMQTAAKEKLNRAVNITGCKQVEFRVCLPNAKTEETTWSIMDTDHVVSQLE